MRSAVLVTFGVLGIVSACGGDGGVRESVEWHRTSQPIYARQFDTTPVPPDVSNQFENTVKVDLVFPAGGASCTGTLVSCRDVVTAQHCMTNEGTALATHATITVVEYRKEGRERLTQVFDMDLAENQNFKLRSPEERDVQFIGGRDVAILKLPSSVRAVQIPRLLDESVPYRSFVGQPNAFSTAGFGRSNGLTECTPTGGDRRTGPITITSFHDDDPTFDYFIEGSPTALTDSIPQFGDSGGPLFLTPVESGAPPILAGTVVGVGPCPSTAANFTIIANHKAWIEDFVGSVQDADSDGTPDACDNCPNTVNDQVDSDADGVGDACDSDRDGDGVANASDNCPDTANATQDNCNEDAEIALGRPHLGDACDPNPCSSVKLRGTGTFTNFLTDPDCGLTAADGCPLVRRGIGWRGVVAGEQQGTDGTTIFAHCNCDLPHDTAQQRVDNCQVDLVTNGNRCVAAEPRAFPRGTPEVPSQWRGITTTEFAAPDAFTLDYLRQIRVQTQGSRLIEHLTRDHEPAGGPRQGVSWLFEEDLEEFGIPAPSVPFRTVADIQPTAAALSGMGWAFTSSFGQTEPQFFGDPPPMPLPPPDSALSNNYYDDDLDPRSAKVFDLHNLPDIRGLIVMADLPLTIGCRYCPRWLVASGGDFFGIARGGVIDPSPFLSPSFRGILPRLNDGLTYAQAAEPVSVLTTRFQTNVRGVLLDTGGTAAVHLVRDAQGVLDTTELVTRDFSRARPELTAFSGSRFELFFADSSEQLESIARYSFANDELVASELTGVDASWTPKALAFRLEDQFLYLLDEQGSGTSRQWRIVRVSPTGEGQVLGIVSNATARTSAFLVPTYEGRLLLAASGGLTDYPLLLLLEPLATRIDVVASALLPTAGRIALPPDALSPSEYAIAIEGTAGVSLTAALPSGFSDTGATAFDDAGSILAARATCGNTSGLAKSSWPVGAGCPTRIGSTSIAGPETSNILWQLDTPGNINAGAAVGTDGTIYQPEGSRLRAIAPNGTVRWTFSEPLGSIRSVPAVSSKGRIYFGSLDERLYAVTQTGVRLWSFDTDHSILSSPVIGSNETVFVGTNGHEVLALDANSGALRFRAPTGGDVETSPALSPDGARVCAGADDFRLYCFRTDTGALVFKVSLGGLVKSSPAFAADGTLYVGSDSNGLYAITPDGTIRWSYPTLGDVRSSPAIAADGTIVFGSDDNSVRALADRGDHAELLWSFQTGGDIKASALITPNAVFVPSMDDRLYALALDAAAPSRMLWSLDLHGDVTASPAIGTNGILYVGTQTERLYAIGP